MSALAEHLLAPECRLLQGHNARDGSSAIRIAHDVLLDHAEAFRAFRDAERDNVILLADARDAAARWATEGRPATLLNHHLPSVARLEILLTRLGAQADDELTTFAAASRHRRPLPVPACRRPEAPEQLRHLALQASARAAGCSWRTWWPRVGAPALRTRRQGPPPILPLVISTTGAPATSRPSARAVSRMARAGLSLTLPPGCMNSAFARMRPGPGSIRSRATSGVLPIRSRAEGLSLIHI